MRLAPRTWCRPACAPPALVAALACRWVCSLVYAAICYAKHFHSCFNTLCYGRKPWLCSRDCSTLLGIHSFACRQNLKSIPEVAGVCVQAAHTAGAGAGGARHGGRHARGPRGPAVRRPHARAARGRQQRRRRPAPRRALRSHWPPRHAGECLTAHQTSGRQVAGHGLC